MMPIQSGYAVLQVDGVQRHFGGVRALDGVSFSVQAGECVALIGPNGAGKSTCFACIAGQERLNAGQIVWRGERVDGLSPKERLARGMARTFQVAQTFEALSARQNVQLALSVDRLQVWDRLDARHGEAADQALQDQDLMAWRDTPVMYMPYGAKKRLELALALAGLQRAGGTAGDRAGAAWAGQSGNTGDASVAKFSGLLLLDEPAAGLQAQERADLMQRVQVLSRRGLAVLYTEHNMDAVFGVADRVLVLMDGQLLAQGRAEEVAAHPVVQSRYLGQGFAARQEQEKRSQAASGEPHAAN